MPHATWTVDGPAFADEVPAKVLEAVGDWQVRSAAVGFWLRMARSQVGDSDVARVELDYDEQIGLLSFDAFVGERRVYGADDFVG